MHSYVYYHSFIRLFIHLFIHPFTHSFIHTGKKNLYCSSEVIEEKPEKPQEDQNIEQHKEIPPKTEEVKEHQNKTNRAESRLTDRKNGDIFKILDGKVCTDLGFVICCVVRYNPA
jgi:DNA-binding transcriptional regulator GbsR (MarR family)